MNMRRRKKAISKVIKLLNLATSSNVTEAQMALRHAEALIHQNGLNQGEIPGHQLCDRMMLYKVSWNGNPLHARAKEDVARCSAGSVYSRRFSEKPFDSGRSYANAKTILDDVAEVELTEGFEDADDCGSDESSRMTKGDQYKENISVADGVNRDQDKLFDAHIHCYLQIVENLNASNTQTFESTEHDVEDVQAQMKETLSNENMETIIVDDIVSGPKENVSKPKESGTSKGFTYDDVSAQPHDNVIDAASAFRAQAAKFQDTLRNQYSSSNPDLPFEEDEYWNKVSDRLLDFDEVSVLTSMEEIGTQLTLAKELLSQKRNERAEIEQEELQERAERARIEQSFEEAIERAFRARAKAYEAWEASQNEVRMTSLRAEQEAQQGFEELQSKLDEQRNSYKQHLQLKEDYCAAKIMHELRNALSNAAKGGEAAINAYDKVTELLHENALSLRDLEFSDIKNKSLFIRLLERETALIENVDERERYTEEMLDKFLLVSRAAKENKFSENPVQQIERLLKSVASSNQYEGQKIIEQSIRLMEQYGVSVKDLDYGCIAKYSVFVRLINWEAEQISSLKEREKFTASILEEYVQYSVAGPTLNEDLNGTSNNK
ncbi:DUF2786 domain-containing protein [Marinomonas mediterranea]|jgi:Protein of unknown function (DUF2786).|uniref:DUF2786 domain-containing protein n=1 Tax=Marinomonas mediterranea (strain ATCC 700492 / JCM 21426 / NBRC 103028 / MMB-1) TaxID=717774 RepID=F2JWK3_MARM1|nr:DUF2786 domain-containing protein [Marinomonas mediterranea]ADZ91767.1 hypothetical protein Marme_2535 [Marinomonas mediterranea MMB-1]WCN09724.1 DUF2786 domain-containing protein [Marinomonas mediterranea]WCN13805.1 DUF2786 domain-containing protein [Marinomonas mediterranea]WCN17861.1 DUF2786 domain-containing protein [Marinomonas mediterranea MMB-1]